MGGDQREEEHEGGVFVLLTSSSLGHYRWSAPLNAVSFRDHSYCQTTLSAKLFSISITGNHRHLLWFGFSRKQTETEICTGLSWRVLSGSIPRRSEDLGLDTERR
jgi:hypothetical protein